MAVQINIGASAGGAVDALKQIKDAIDKAGQSGREFSKLDLSHPELAGMADDIRKLSARFQDLARVGRGATATAFRGVNRAGGDPSDPLMWEANLTRAFPDPAERERHRQSVLGYATRNTRWAQPQQPPAAAGGTGGVPPGGGAGAAPVAGGGGGGAAPVATLGTMAAGILGGAAAFIGLKALGEVKDFAVRSVGLARQEAENTEDLYRHTDQVKSYEELRDAIMATTKGLGVTAQEAGALALSFAKVTGQTDAVAIGANVRMGIGFGRSFGMDPALATQGIGQATVAGLDPAKFAVLVGEAAGKGGRSADETMPALLRLAEAATRTLVTHSNELETASMLAGLNAMGLPGFRGANAEAVMNTLGASISQGGNAGMASAAVSYRVGRSQGVTDPYDLKYLQEGGLFANAQADLGYGSSTSNLQARLAEIQREYAGLPRNRMLNAMENDLGLNMRQSQELLRYKPADLSTTFNALQGAHLNLTDLNPTAIGDTVRIANAGQGDLETIRQQMLGRHGQGTLSAEDQKALSDAGPDSLRTTLLQMAGKYGQSETEGSKTRDLMATLSNSLTDLGRSLITPLNDLASVEGYLVKGVADLTDVLADTWKAGKGDPEAQARLRDRGSALLGGAGARGDRNNNPLNLEYAGQAGAGSDGRFATFATPEAGIAAADRQLLRYQSQGQVTLRQMISKWAPPGENDTASYIAQVASETGIGADSPVNMSDPMVASRVIGAMGHHEVGHKLDPSMVARGVQQGMGGPSADAPAAQVNGQVTVVHVDQAGNVLHTQDLPVTDVRSPQPWGPPRIGQSAAKPPPPPQPSTFSLWSGI